MENIKQGVQNIGQGIKEKALDAKHWVEGTG